MAHNSGNMCTHGLPDMYTLSPWALGVHTYQANNEYTCYYYNIIIMPLIVYK